MRALDTQLRVPVAIQQDERVRREYRPDALLALRALPDCFAKAPLHVNVEALTPRYEAMRNVGKEKFSRSFVRVDDAILVRVPRVRR